MRSSVPMLFICLAVLVAAPALASANGFYTPSVGVRSGAMGGAFIGLADDYSAVYWNPAGITQIKGMEVTGTVHDVVSLASRDGFVRFEGYEGELDGNRFALASIEATSESENKLYPGFFFYTDAGPLKSVVDKVGLTAYTLSGYGVTWRGDTVLDNNDFVGHERDFDLRAIVADMQDYGSDLQTYVVSPVVAKEIFPGLSVGLTANIAYSHMKLEDVFLESYVDTIDTPEPEDDYWLYLTPVQTKDDVTGTGYGATFGLLYRANSQISAGLTVRSPMTIAYDGTFTFRASGGDEVVELKYNSEYEVKYPMWAGAGFAYRDFLFDGLTLTADVAWTNWSTIESIDRTIQWGGDWTPEELETLSVFESTQYQWEDTIEVGVGFDYRIGRSLLVNLGYRNSPSPIPDGPDYDYYDFVVPISSKTVIAGGVTYLQDFWRCSFALEYSAGETRRLSRTFDMDGKHLEDLLVPTLSFTYAF